MLCTRREERGDGGCSPALPAGEQGKELPTRTGQSSTEPPQDAAVLAQCPRPELSHVSRGVEGVSMLLCVGGGPFNVSLAGSPGPIYFWMEFSVLC